MSLAEVITEWVGDAFAALGLDRSFGEVVVSQRAELAQFQCNGALQAARPSGKAPRELADGLVSLLADRPELEAVSAAGPGFLNLTLTDEFLAGYCQKLVHDPRLGVPLTTPPLKVVVDYAGPNVAKAMHAGHLRATIIGDSLARLFRFAGHQVTRDPHFGDWGVQMGLTIVGIEERWPDLPYFDPRFKGPYPDTSPITLEDLQEIYPDVSARQENDEKLAERARQVTLDLQQGTPGYRALWHHMKQVSEESQRRDFATLGVEFDLWYGESDVRDRLAPMIERLVTDGVAERSEGALVIRIDEPGDKRELPPFILEKSDGGFLYSTTDLATVEFRAKELGADLVLYVVDRRQSDHLEAVFRAARRASIAPPHMRLEHIPFGTMNGPDGRPFKTRAGGVVTLGDLIALVIEAAHSRIDEAEIARGYSTAEREQIALAVGIAALKFGDLSNHRNSDYLFLLDRFTSFDGKTGPYLQYGAVRIKSIIRNADALGLERGPMLPATHPAERSLLLHLSMLPEVIFRAIDTRAPNHVAEYAFELAGAWNRFYDACHILNQPDLARRASWLTLAETTLAALTLLLDLLGIEVPERM